MDHAHHACFLAGGKSLQCAACSVTPLLVMPREWVFPSLLEAGRRPPGGAPTLGTSGYPVRGGGYVAPV